MTTHKLEWQQNCIGVPLKFVSDIRVIFKLLMTIRLAAKANKTVHDLAFPIAQKKSIATLFKKMKKASIALHLQKVKLSQINAPSPVSALSYICDIIAV